MIKVCINCQQEYFNTIKRKLNMHFSDIVYTDIVEENIIFIKQVKEMQDVEQLSLYKGEFEYIFIIENGEYMFELLEYNPSGFIRLNYLEQDIEKIIQKLNYKNKGIGTALKFKVGYQNIRIESNIIEYIESYGHYLLIHTSSAQFKVREKISNIVSKLESLGFVRVHKSYIVNTDFISITDNNELRMKSGVIIPISGTYKSNIKNIK